MRELDDQEATAEYLRLAEHTLEQWRWRRTGPPYVRCGGRIRYRRQDVDTWLREQTIPPRGAA
jgi:hypothetical protein